MRKPVNLKKLTKHWNKVREETIKICMKNISCCECPFSMCINSSVYCHLGRLNAAIEKLKGTPNFAQVELPELIVNEERGDKK